MTDSKKPAAAPAEAPVEAATSAPGEKRAASRPAPVLAKAAESGDPSVHQLIAAIYTAEQNGDDDLAEAARKELLGLGYE